MGIESVFSLVAMITLVIISVTLILVSIIGITKQYVSMKKEGEEFDVNISVLFFTLFIPLVYINTLVFVVYFV